METGWLAEQDDFQIYEMENCKIRSWKGITVPLQLACSSTALAAFNRVAHSTEAAIQFCLDYQARRSVSILRVSEDVDELCGHHRIDRLSSAFGQSAQAEGTSLYDAIYLAAEIG